MNTKKLLISGAIATGMLVSCAMPAVYAANTTNNGKNSVCTFANGTMTVIAKKANGVEYPKLTKVNVESLVKSEFADATVTSAGNCGTGSTVTLGSGEKFSLVLMGDVDKNGEINLDDARAIAEATIKGAKLDDTQKKAADVLDIEGEKEIGVDLDDARAVAEMAYNKLTSAEYAMVEAKIPAEEMVSVDVADTVTEALEKAAEKFENLAKVKFDPETNTAQVAVTEVAKEKTVEEFYNDKDLRSFAKSFVNEENDKIASDIKSIKIAMIKDPITINADGVVDAIYQVKDKVKDILVDKYIKKYPEKTEEEAIKAIKAKKLSDIMLLAEDMELSMTIELDENGSSLFSDGTTKQTFNLEFVESLAK